MKKDIDISQSCKKEKHSNLFWYLFRAPDSIIAFISGAFISAAINIFTDKTSDLFQLISAVMMFIVSLLLVLWMVIVKPLEEEFKAAKGIIEKTSETISNYSSLFWKDLINKRKSVKIGLLLIFSFSMLCILGSILLLIIPRFV